MSIRSAFPKSFAPPEFEPGWVWLVGAGPGDPGLLTLNAAHALSTADVVVYDALVDERILELARPGAELIYAGKRGGRPSPKQRAISLRLVELAREGHRVLRLKGGDPFVFGRGGEEKAYIEAHGIDVELVPGVTAATGAGAATGIPLTHRDDAQAVTFVTGFFQGGTPDLDWMGLARGGQTVVVYMGVGTAGLIADELLAHGAPGARPVAVIERASLPDQRLFTGRLDGLERLVADNRVTGPALLVIGDVVRHANEEKLTAIARPADAMAG